jgi:hypothetical protein
MYERPSPPPEGHRTSGNLDLLPEVAAPSPPFALLRAGHTKPGVLMPGLGTGHRRIMLVW